jgi:GT2 family glycosyltransferase
MEDKVCVVTVTYGNRFHLLKLVVDVALKEGVCKVIVVDNNSEPEVEKS